MNNQEVVRHYSLFSGIESFKKALTNLGIDNELVGYSELDKYASVALAAIHGVSEGLNYGDITKIDEKKVPDCDLITYGFPCQDISVAGLGKGIVEGETRSGLLFDALRIIKYKKPKYAIAENVKNLVGKKFKEDFDSLLEELESYGYNNYWKVLNSKDFGIPQNRERVFIVSIRKDIDDGNFEFPKGQNLKCTLEDFLDEEVDEKYEMGEYMQYYKKSNNNFKPNEINEIGHIEKEGWYRLMKCVLNPMGISTTLTTVQGGNLEVKIPYKDKIRKLTPLEYWRLMGFSDEDYFKARKALEDRFYNGNDRSNSQMYKMAGNSIVVDVLEGILKNLI